MILFKTSVGQAHLPENHLTRPSNSLCLDRPCPRHSSATNSAQPRGEEILKLLRGNCDEKAVGRTCKPADSKS